MAKSNSIAAIILGAAVGLTLLRFFNLSKAERNQVLADIKYKSHDLLDDAEATVEKVKHYVEELKSKSADEWTDKIFVMKNMLKDLYGAEHRLLR
jgi:uncharacterized Rmd1/YagE family protein